MIENNILPFPDLESATGKIPYNMTNDYMFRAVLQKNNKVLRGLIGALLHLSEDEMLSVEITNPIVLGDAIDNKEFRLDINVELNNKSVINLKMQVDYFEYWNNRSLSYLCRSFDQLSHGQSYADIRPMIHIGILDHTLFTDYPEFYAKYRFMNVKNHKIYNDNFALNVLDLKQIHLATPEDKEYQIDQWALLFKSTTWEELKAMASQNEYFNEASDTVFTLSADAQIQKRCRDREDYYADMRGMQETIDKLNKENEERKVELQAKNDEIALLKKKLAAWENNPK